MKVSELSLLELLEYEKYANNLKDYLSMRSHEVATKFQSRELRVREMCYEKLYIIEDELIRRLEDITV